MSSERQQQIIVEAARWLAFLQSGERDSVREHAFLDWQAQDPRHAEAISTFQQRLNGLRQPLKDVRQDQLLKTLNAPSSRRSFLRGSLALAGLALGAGVLSRFGSSGFAWPGDLYTGIGERRTFSLPDGSSAQLNAGSRITPQFHQTERGLSLQRGELLLDVCALAEPFYIRTDAAVIMLRQQRVLVRQEADGWLTLAQQAPLQLTDATGAVLTLKPGNWARFNTHGVFDSGQARGGESDWTRGLLNVNNRSLAEVVESLKPYYRGVLNVAPQVAALRVSGIFPLDDPRHALNMLASILPIRLNYTTDYWLSVEPA
jgi:transmembrane sensor